MKIITYFFCFLFIVLVCSSQVYTQNVIKILNLGNSIVQGEKKGEVVHDSYRRRLAQMLDVANIAYDMVGSMDKVYVDPNGEAQHLNTDFDRDHEGHWGWRADEIINGRPGKGKLSEWIPYYDIDFVVMRIGTNDLLWQTDSENPNYQNILDEIAQIIAILRGKNPNVVVFLSNFTPYNNSVLPLPNSDKVIPFNNLLPAFVSGISIANSPVILVDQYTGFNAVVGADTYDGIHPNVSGEEKMAQKFFDAIETYLETTTTWNGGSNNWLTASNWSNGVPNINNVFIPSGLANYPTLNSPGKCNNLVIESSSNSTGSIIGQQHLTVHGTVTIERHMNGNAWHLVSSPTPGQTISSFLAENSNIPSNGSVRGMMDYNTDTNDWYDFFEDDAPGDLTAGKGFSLRTVASGTVNFSGGSLEQGMVNAAVTTSGERWNAIGNPYPSSIYINDAAHPENNFIKINMGNFDPSYAAKYVWEHSNNEYTIITQSDDVDYMAQMGQAFMVRAKNGVTVFQFTTDMQTHAPEAAFKSASVAWPEAKLIVKNQENESRYAKIRFNDNMNKGLDPGYDAGVFKTGFDVYTQLLEDNGVDFGVQCLPVFGMETFEIPVSLDIRADGEISFSFDNQNLPLGIVPVLNDKLKGEKYIFDTGNGVYTTMLNENTGYGRFTITFATATDINDKQELKLKAWYSNDRITVSGNITPGTRAKLLNIQGQVLLETRLKNVNHSYLDVSGFQSGIYLLQIENEGRRQIIKIPVTN